MCSLVNRANIYCNHQLLTVQNGYDSLWHSVQQTHLIHPGFAVMAEATCSLFDYHTLDTEILAFWTDLALRISKQAAAHGRCMLKQWQFLDSWCITFPAFLHFYFQMILKIWDKHNYKRANHWYKNSKAEIWEMTGCIAGLDHTI